MLLQELGTFKWLELHHHLVDVSVQYLFELKSKGFSRNWLPYTSDQIKIDSETVCLCIVHVEPILGFALH